MCMVCKQPLDKYVVAQEPVLNRTERIADRYSCDWCRREVVILQRDMTSDDLYAFGGHQKNQLINIQRVLKIGEENFRVFFTHHCVLS